jgi:hypothetical protein
MSRPNVMGLPNRLRDAERNCEQRQYRSQHELETPDALVR